MTGSPDGMVNGKLVGFSLDQVIANPEAVQKTDGEVKHLLKQSGVWSETTGVNKAKMEERLEQTSDIDSEQQQFRAPVELSKNLREYFETTALKPELLEGSSVAEVSTAIVQVIEENPKLMNSLRRKIVFKIPGLKQRENASIATLSINAILSGKYKY